jgi:hypothetical protein
MKLPDDIEQSLLDGRRLRATTLDLALRRGIRFSEARKLVRRWLFERQQAEQSEPPPDDAPPPDAR